MTHLENTQSLREALAVAEAKLAAAESKVLEINDAYTTLDAKYASEQTHAAALEAKLAAAEQQTGQLFDALVDIAGALGYDVEDSTLERTRAGVLARIADDEEAHCSLLLRCSAAEQSNAQLRAALASRCGCEVCAMTANACPADRSDAHSALAAPALGAITKGDEK